MRLFTLPLFAFLLAVSAAGQDYMATVGISARYQPYSGISLPPAPAQLCSGLVLTPWWVLTAGHCVFSDVGVNPKSAVVFGADGHGQRHLKIVAEADPNDRQFLESGGNDRTLGNLALIHTACTVNDRTASRVFVSGWAMGGGGLSGILEQRIENSGPPHVEVDVTPYPRINPDTGRIDTRRPPDDERTRSGVARKVNDVWTFESSGDPLPEEYVDGSPVWVWAHDAYSGGGAVGIYIGEVNGVPTLVDISTKWEWISKTVRDESISLPELCRGNYQY